MSRINRLALLLVLLHLLLASAYSISNPLGEAPDETDHWAYVVYLGREQHLPEGSGSWIVRDRIARIMRKGRQSLEP